MHWKCRNEPDLGYLLNYFYVIKIGPQNEPLMMDGNPTNCETRRLKVGIEMFALHINCLQVAKFDRVAIN